MTFSVMMISSFPGSYHISSLPKPYYPLKVIRLLLISQFSLGLCTTAHRRLGVEFKYLYLPHTSILRKTVMSWFGHILFRWLKPFTVHVRSGVGDTAAWSFGGLQNNRHTYVPSMRIKIAIMWYLFIHSELTPCSRNTKLSATLRVFPILTLTLCSTWFVMPRSRNAC